MSPRGRAGAGGPRHRSAAGGLALAAGLLLGCPRADPTEADQAAPVASEPLPTPDPALRAKAHAEALAALRKHALPALRQLDPVAAAEVEGTPLHPPAFGAAARAAAREAIDQARREAAGIRPELLSPADGVVLRVLAHALERGHHRLERPPWRDDPGALFDEVEPYLRALERRAAAGGCDDGCGLLELGPALETGLREVGSASVPALAAARDDLAAIQRALPRICEGLLPTHAIVTARPELDAALVRLDAALAQAAAALPAAAEVAWAEPVAPAEPAAWKRRPARWTAARLRRVLEDDEAFGLPPARLFELAETTAARLRAMRQREDARGEPVVEAAVPQPFDAAACEATWAPLRTWVSTQAPTLVAELDCAALVRRVSPIADDAAIVRQLVVLGIVEPTRRARVAATGVDVALVQGRAAPLAQALTLEIAIAAGSHQPAVMRDALRQAHHHACVAAAATWIHGELGEDEPLRERLRPHACGDVEGLVAQAEARPAAALRGLGLGLIGNGPADAAALDRYFWAPIGLVPDLALPPPPTIETGSSVQVEELGDREAALQRLEAVATGDDTDAP